MAIEPRTDALSWDECFMRIARTIAQRSKDPSTQAGAVIATKENVVVGLGYNGFPRGVENNTFPWEREGDLVDTKYAYICHAEENAIYNAITNTHDTKIYTTLFPCNECAKAIIQTGIKEVVYESNKHAHLQTFMAAPRMFDAAGVVYRQYICDWE